MRHPLLPSGVTVLERGWLSSNNVILHGANPDEGAVLIDTGYGSHAQQTLALIQESLAREHLRLIINTHLHSDHCGGNARLAEEYGCDIRVPPGDYEAAVEWDEDRLSFEFVGQSCERFVPDGTLKPGDSIQQGGRLWEVHSAPGHDPHSVVLFEPDARIIVSADALWERSFGIVFPELDGREGFDDVEATLDLIERLDPQCVIPGHGPIFGSPSVALRIARERLRYFRSNPERHALHAAKALTVFHMLDASTAGTPAELNRWILANPALQALWHRFYAKSETLQDWAGDLVGQLKDAGLISFATVTVPKPEH